LTAVEADDVDVPGIVGVVAFVTAR